MHLIDCPPWRCLHGVLFPILEVASYFRGLVEWFYENNLALERLLKSDDWLEYKVRYI